MSLATWSPLERHLDGFDRIRVGMPRNGGFLAQQPLLTMRNFASLAGDLLDHLDIERADVLGLSFGAMVAQQLAHDMPTRVRRLVLVSTSCGLAAAPGNPVSWWFAMLADTGTPRPSLSHARKRVSSTDVTDRYPTPRPA
jgi:poly(3-hydroxyoctanoate) depolymerase